MKLMKFRIKKRLLVLSLLPQEGSLKDILRLKQLRPKVDFSSEELKEIDFNSTEKGSLSWLPENDKEIEVEFTDIEVELLKDICEELDTLKKITPDNVDFCLEVKIL